MKIAKHLLIFSFILSGISGFSQTKKELMDQVESQKKSLDSMKAVIDNLDNIVETRDRTIKFLREEKEELNTDKEELYTKIRQKNTELSNLRKQAATGAASLKLMNNKRPILKVPTGKYWIINQFIADYVTDLAVDSTGNMVGEEVHVFIKSLNGAVLTDPAKNMYGPQVYSSIQSNHTIQFPLVLTENTSFAIIVMQGNIGSMVESPGNVYISLTAKDN